MKHYANEHRPFFAAYDEHAQWYDELKPLGVHGQQLRPFAESWA